MKIKKIAQAVGLVAKVLNAKSDSKQDTYSCDYINKITEANIVTGVEYETGRIIDGKKEYGKRIDCGNLPNNATKSIPHGLTNVKFTRPITGIANSDDTDLSLPYVDVSNLGRGIQVLRSGANINLISLYNWSTLTAYVDLYYTKN